MLPDRALINAPHGIGLRELADFSGRVWYHVRAMPPSKPRQAEQSNQPIPSGVGDAAVKIGSKTVQLTNLGKPFWPGIAKRDLLRYYADVAPYLLPHLKDRAM